MIDQLKLQFETALRGNVADGLGGKAKAAESCQDCIEYESLNPWLPGELPSFCRHNCQCRIVRSDGKLGFDPFDD